MRKSIVFLVFFIVGVSGVAQKKKDLIKQVAQLKAAHVKVEAKLDSIHKAHEVNLQDDLQSLSYALGIGIGSDLKNSGLDSLSYNTFAAALRDAFNGKGKLSEKEANTKVRTTLARLKEERDRKLREEGESFLAENGKRPEIRTTASGLQYEIITEGEGEKPKAADRVKVHYTGMLKDGKVFDSSVERGEPIDFLVTGVIKGWQEALQLMPVGSKWKLYIPQELAYGEKGAGNGAIPAFAPLIFEVEVLEIVR